MKKIIESLNKARRQTGYLTIEDMIEVVAVNNVVYDPFSTLIADSVALGTGNVFYPCVRIARSEVGELSIGDGNIFHTNTVIEASEGVIRIGANNQFGEGGFVAKANRAKAHITIGDNGRFLNGANVYGESFLGHGTQLLGAVVVDSCTLHAGESYQHPHPDERGALLKGFGTARGIVLNQGQVIQGNGSFSLDAVKQQSYYH